MRSFGLLAGFAISSLASGIMAAGGRAGYDPQNPNPMVPITSRNIGRDILKPSRNSKYRPHSSDREQKRFARNLALGRYRFVGQDLPKRAYLGERFRDPGKSVVAEALRDRDLTLAPEIREYSGFNNVRFDGLGVPLPEMGEPTPELTIADYDDGPVSIQAEIPHPGTPIPAEDFATSRAEGMEPRVEVDHDTFMVHETPEGLKEGDVEALKLFVTEGTLRPGVRRDRLRDAGFIEYGREGCDVTAPRAWFVTSAGHALFNDRRRS